MCATVSGAGNRALPNDESSSRLFAAPKAEIPRDLARDGVCWRLLASSVLPPQAPLVGSALPAYQSGPGLRKVLAAQEITMPSKSPRCGALLERQRLT
jgi:hypothetical protein